MKHICILTFCLITTAAASIATSAHAVGADSQVSDSNDDTSVSKNAKRRWSSFSNDGLRKRLSSPKAKVRKLALRDIKRRYYDHPELPDLLVQAVTDAIAAANVSETTLTMVRRRMSSASAGILRRFRSCQLRIGTMLCACCVDRIRNSDVHDQGWRMCVVRSRQGDVVRH